MLKIIIKSIILVCIILSIYFIVNPAACSNFINGRAVNVREDLPVITPDNSRNELLEPAGDQPLRPAEKPAKTTPAVSAQTAQPQTLTTTAAQTQPVQPAAATASTKPVTAVTDTQSLQAADSSAAATQRPQAEVDYAIASRYVELENKYLAQHKDAKNAAKDISYIVMDDFELTPAEWEAFLQRATASNLFETVRQQQK